MEIVDKERDVDSRETDLISKHKIKRLACYCGHCDGRKMDYEERKKLIKENKILIINHPCTLCGDRLAVIL